MLPSLLICWISSWYALIVDPELEQAEALQYLLGWLQHHPKYRQLVQTDAAEHLSHKEVDRLLQQTNFALHASTFFLVTICALSFQVETLFSTAASLSPEDGDVHTVLGVLYNLSREYDKAIDSFQMALKLKPRDYSLWNKFGATQANSARSADAISAYQQVSHRMENSL